MLPDLMHCWYLQAEHCFLSATCGPPSQITKLHAMYTIQSTDFPPIPPNPPLTLPHIPL